jgi:PhzF family phenazine biosynthesis protein
MTNQDIHRIAAFADGSKGGNPAGVMITDTLPSAPEMQEIAAKVGYSETVFAAPFKDGWRVRYFSPEVEVAFCGHATVALGAVLAEREGSGRFPLQLNDGPITVEASGQGDELRATVTSPPTHSAAADPALVQEALTLFGLTTDDLDPALPAGLAHAGNDHLILLLRSREVLAQMTYDLDAGAALMTRYGLATINLLWAETPRLFHSRNAFAIGGVLEDPATGAAAAALSGYLRDLNWPHDGTIDIIQGQDMGARSLLRAEIGATSGEGIRVSGRTRVIAA